VAVAGLGMGVGIGCMSILTRYLSNISLVSLGFSIVSIILIALGFTTTPWLAFVLVFTLGFGNAFITAPVQTIIQERTPKTISGKVFSVQNLVSSFAFTLPPIIAGLLADLFGYRVIFVTLGIMAFVLNLLSKKIRK
jgi:MFS family permease